MPIHIAVPLLIMAFVCGVLAIIMAIEWVINWLNRPVTIRSVFIMALISIISFLIMLASLPAQPPV